MSDDSRAAQQKLPDVSVASLLCPWQRAAAAPCEGRELGREELVLAFIGERAALLLETREKAVIAQSCESL